MYAGETFEIEAGGYPFRVRIEADQCMGAPWEEHDGHGVVSDWTTRDKRPGEIVLNTDRSSRRYYDVEASMKIARRDGWGLRDEHRLTLLAELRRVTFAVRGDDGRFRLQEQCGPWKPLTKGEITAGAVRRDFEFLHGWCNDDWQWVGVVVELLDEDGEVVDGVGDSLWGIESEADDYLRQTARDMAEGLALGLQKEACERMYWNARDMVTV
ncbi:hypothetical protein [Paraburkholderia fungorum]|uniref:hypothetical protein n=1 Tax=Paraburkholderia fungorum TaxID=134537 RepID=UPI0038BC1ABE